MENVTLTMKPESYRFLRSTLDGHKDFLHKVAMPPLIKSELLKDVSKINIVLNDAEKAGAK